MILSLQVRTSSRWYSRGEKSRDKHESHSDKIIKVRCCSYIEHRKIIEVVHGRIWTIGNGRWDLFRNAETLTRRIRGKFDRHQQSLLVNSILFNAKICRGRLWFCGSEDKNFMDPSFVEVFLSNFVFFFFRR